MSDKKKLVLMFISIWLVALSIALNIGFGIESKRLQKCLLDNACIAEFQSKHLMNNLDKCILDNDCVEQYREQNSGSSNEPTKSNGYHYTPKMLLMPKPNGTINTMILP